jgi:hypothetical protein
MNVYLLELGTYKISSKDHLTEKSYKAKFSSARCCPESFGAKLIWFLYVFSELVEEI